LHRASNSPACFARAAETWRVFRNTYQFDPDGKLLAVADVAVNCQRLQEETSEVTRHRYASSLGDELTGDKL
jgi:hypothetical protein